MGGDRSPFKLPCTLLLTCCSPLLAAERDESRAPRPSCPLTLRGLRAALAHSRCSLSVKLNSLGTNHRLCSGPLMGPATLEVGVSVLHPASQL